MAWQGRARFFFNEGIHMTVKRYFAARGAHYSDDMAAKLGQVLESLGEAVTPQSVVDAARPKRSPIHRLFEWDNEEAAERYRIWQARQHISHLRIEIVGDGEATETRAYHSIVIQQGEEKHRAYVGTPTILTDADMKQQAITNALKQLKSWRERYREYSDVFGKVFRAIDRAEKELTEAEQAVA